MGVRESLQIVLRHSAMVRQSRLVSNKCRKCSQEMRKHLLKRQEKQWTIWQDWDGKLVNKEQQMHQCCTLSSVHLGTSGSVLGVWHRCC